MLPYRAIVTASTAGFPVQQQHNKFCGANHWGKTCMNSFPVLLPSQGTGVGVDNTVKCSQITQNQKLDVGKLITIAEGS